MKVFFKFSIFILSVLISLTVSCFLFMPDHPILYIIGSGGIGYANGRFVVNPIFRYLDRTN